MTDPIPLAPVEANELLLVSRHRGQVDVWVGWKRALGAFADPRLWESTEHWPEHFSRQPPGTPYGPDGYGLVVMDLDARKGWSVNDFTHPGSIVLPHSHERDHPDETGSRAALAQLLARPDQWPHVALEVTPAPGLLDLLKGRKDPIAPSIRTLDQILDASAGPDARQAALLQRRGTLAIAGRPHLVSQVHYRPKGWTLATDLERPRIDVLEECLAHLRAEGVPLPSPELIRSEVESAMADLEEDEGQELAGRFQALLDGWVPRAPKPPRMR